MNKISISGLSVYACHGVLDVEKEQEQPFIVSADIWCDFYEAAMCDDVTKTVNYAEVCELIEKTVSGESYNLIETLCYEIAFRITEEFPSVIAADVTVSKPNAPVSPNVENISVGVSVKRETSYLSIGSSLGDRKGYLDFAVEELKKTKGVSVLAVSSYMESEPYGGVAKNKFLNGAVKIETVLDPRQLLREIHRIEDAAGRERDVRWGDRTLDIDIIFFGGPHGPSAHGMGPHGPSAHGMGPHGPDRFGPGPFGFGHSGPKGFGPGPHGGGGFDRPFPGRPGPGGEPFRRSSPDLRAGGEEGFGPGSGPWFGDGCRQNSDFGDKSANRDGKPWCRDGDIVIPHPDFHNREFVLRPLAEIAPEFKGLIDRLLGDDGDEGATGATGDKGDKGDKGDN